MQFVDGIDWDEAVDKIGDKTPIGSLLSSDEWSDVPLALRERAFFSSTIESIRFLQRGRDAIADFLAQNTETVTSPTGKVSTALKVGGRADFIKQMSDFAVSEGMGPLDAADAGTIKDIRSEPRLGMIFDIQNQSAHDYTYWKQGMNPDVLDAYPAQQFVRERDVKTPRPLHQQNEGVIRLKSDLPFWLAMNDPAIGGFGVPWGPWGFGPSGMGVEDVDRETTEKLGILDPGEKVQPVEKDFNDKLEASTQGLDPDMIDKLKDAFGDQVEFDEDEDVVRWKSASSPSSRPSPPGEGETPIAPVPGISMADSLAGVLSDLNLDADQQATADDMVALRESLKEEDPTDATRVIKYIKGAQPDGVLTDANIQGAVQEFLDFIPPKIVAQLPELKLEVKRISGAYGQYRQGGFYDLDRDLLKNDPKKLRKNTFHELMHWLHTQGDQDFRDAIADHFADRTSGETVVNLKPYASRGKKDRWYDPYAGTIYPFEDPAAAGGLEVPTRYMEWLAMDPDDMARLWNRPEFRETMKVVLNGLF